MNAKLPNNIIRAEPTGLPLAGWYALVHDEMLTTRDGCGRIFPSELAAINAGWRVLERAMRVMCEGDTAGRIWARQIADYNNASKAMGLVGR